jgi:hypothetical protein
MNGRVRRVNGIGHSVITVPVGGYFARLHRRLEQRLPAWVIYKPVTREYPGSWVARMHVTLPEHRVTSFVMTHDRLEALREMLPSGLVCLARDPNDPTEIEEVWI